MNNHPLMCYRGQRNWPPIWRWTGRGENKFPCGEVGILKEVHVLIADHGRPESHRSHNRVYLFMDYRGSSYVGYLHFDDAAACRQIGEILSKHCGKNIQEIGRIDLSSLL